MTVVGASADGDVRFRCRVGHAYAGDGLLLEQSEAVDMARSSAVRTLRERASLARRIADRLEAEANGSAGAPRAAIP